MSILGGVSPTNFDVYTLVVISTPFRSFLQHSLSPSFFLSALVPWPSIVRATHSFGVKVLLISRATMDWTKEPNARANYNPGLELSRQQEGMEAVQPEKYPADHSPVAAPAHSEKPRRRLPCGLSPLMFGLLIAVITAIVGGAAVGGGVGGSLAGHSR